MRHAMMIDLEKCVGCQACVSSCKQRWGSGPGAARDWVHTFETGQRGKDLAIAFYPGLCMQCEEHCDDVCDYEEWTTYERVLVVQDGRLAIRGHACLESGWGAEDDEE